MASPAFYAEVRELRVERALDAAVELITREGWDRLSMTTVAELSGVPRQSLHKEVGTKAELGRAVVRREVGRFLQTVEAGFAAHPDSPADALVATARNALEHGRSHPLLAAVLRPAHDPALLALVTLDPEAVLGRALDAVRGHVGDRVPEGVLDSLVRLTMSHLLQPTVEVEEAVARIETVVRGCL